MKNLFYKISLVLLLLVFGCENVDPVETKLEFQENIVVRSELVLGVEYEGVTITRTLPIEEEYDIKVAEVQNARAYLKINGVQIVPLHYTVNGVYKPQYTLKFDIPGTTVELIGEVDDKSFYSKTTIPESPSVSRVAREESYAIASVSSKENEVYGAIWSIYSQASNTYIDNSAGFKTISKSDKNSFSVRTTDIPEEYLINPYRSSTYIQVYSFDETYFEYFNSKSNNQVVGNIFTQGGSSVEWNVFGEDVIGMFIGKAIGNMIKIN